jgi:L-rhamnose-H+ transport protein
MEQVAQDFSNPSLGVILFMLGGLSGAIFYLPFQKVKNWAWESYWLIYALVGLVLVPWILALSTSPNLFSVYQRVPGQTLLYCFLCGAMWGIGGLTWGLMIRYLGVGLGLALGCGLCSSAGTLIPPILEGNIGKLYGTGPANASLLGVMISLLGIVLVGLAGTSKENELPEETKKKAVAEYNFKKGLLVAFFSGLMSSAMNFGLQGGKEIEKLAQTVEPVTSSVWKGIPVLVVVLLGGFLVNSTWCLYLNIKNKTVQDYTKKDSPLLSNLFFAGAAGAIWCSQFIFFKTGEPAMGRMAYIGWAVLMASAILFSTLLGIFLGEWKGTSTKTRTLLAAGLLMLILSTMLAAYSGYLGQAVGG